MNSDDSKNYILVAKKEFTTLLIYNLFPCIYQGIQSIWADAKKTSQPRQVYENFQDRLTRVRKWNQDIISGEYERVLKNIKGDWNLEELIKKIFVINTQILAAVNASGPNAKQIKVKVPKGDKFLHCCYKEVARAFYENPLLMEDRPVTISRIEMTKNLQKSYKIIMGCIETAILNLLPIDSLLKDSYDSEGEDATPLYDMYKDNPKYTIQNEFIIPNISSAAISTGGAPQTVPIVPDIQLDNQSIKSVEPDTVSEPALGAKKIFFNETPTQDLLDTNSQDSFTRTAPVVETGISLPIVPQSEVKIDLDVLSINDDQVQTSEAAELPTLDNFDARSFYSDAASE